jgi:hypothetical protein
MSVFVCFVLWRKSWNYKRIGVKNDDLRLKGAWIISFGQLQELLMMNVGNNGGGG